MANTTERLTPLAASAMALAAFACCVPIGVAGVVGVLALGSFFDAIQPWLVAGATVLLAVAAFLSFGRQRSCRTRRGWFSLLVLGLSATVVLSVLLFPQLVAALIADYVL